MANLSVPIAPWLTGQFRNAPDLVEAGAHESGDVISMQNPTMDLRRTVSLLLLRPVNSLTRAHRSDWNKLHEQADALLNSQTMDTQLPANQRLRETAEKFNRTGQEVFSTSLSLLAGVHCTLGDFARAEQACRRARSWPAALMPWQTSIWPRTWDSRLRG